MKICYIEDFVSSTKLAVVRDDKLIDLIIEKKDDSIRVGDIYAGRVHRVLPGMEACFVDIGNSTYGYLKLHRESKIKVGDRLLVQVKKTDKENKRLTLDLEISVGSMSLVYIDSLNGPIFSKSIRSKSQKSRIKSILPSGKFIVRTVAQEMDESSIKNEAIRLIGEYTNLYNKFRKNTYVGILKKTQSQIFEYIGENIINRSILNDGYEQIDSIVYSVYDNIGKDDISSGFNEDLKDKSKYTDAGLNDGFDKNLREYIKNISRDLLTKLDKKKNTDIFESYGVNHKINFYRSKRVDTRVGPYLIIDRTEALTVIDVNTGSFVGDSNYENTVVKANTIAANEIVDQVLMRDLTGIILIDFIDMKIRENKENLFNIIKEGLSKDGRQFTVHGYTKLGLLEISRARKGRANMDYYERVDMPSLSRVPSYEYLLDELERGVQLEVYHRGKFEVCAEDILSCCNRKELSIFFDLCKDKIEDIERKYGVKIRMDV